MLLHGKYKNCLKDSIVMSEKKLIKKVLVLWYSQTGYTARYGKSVAAYLKNEGLDVTADDYRNIDKDSVSGYDLIICGTPVYYYDVPVNFRTWLKTLPPISGVPVAAFITYGAQGGNVHNTGSVLLNHLKEKGGLPVAMESIGNMSTFALTWSTGSVERIMKYSHLPNSFSYQKANNFAKKVLANAQMSQEYRVKYKFDFRHLLRNKPAIGSTKMFINSHGFNKETCTDCGTCKKLCPVEAIDMKSKSIDSDTCIACLGCINNCPHNAIDMTFFGKKVSGYKQFVKEQNIVINEP